VAIRYRSAAVADAGKAGIGGRASRFLQIGVFS
jgi:hypothetical protein